MPALENLNARLTGQEEIAQEPTRREPVPHPDDDTINFTESTTIFLLIMNHNS